METSPSYPPCDGCGLPASPEHIAERVRRLELSTRYRPIHIGILFVALAPPVHPADDFYGPPESNEFFDPFMEALGILASLDKELDKELDKAEDSSKLAEFQRRGYYLSYLSECPIPQKQEHLAATIARLAPVLLRRIRFNYKPKLVAPLGQELAPLIEILRGAGVCPVLTLDQGTVLTVPRAGDREGADLFQKALANMAPGENPASGYDRI